MKLAVKILLAISIVFNVYLIWETIRLRNSKIKGDIMSKAFGGDINKTTWAKGLDSFVAKLRAKDLSVANKKYYYINIWTNWCIPCIKEMPWLDSLAGTINKDVGYIFVSDISDEVANTCIKRKNYNLKNFVFVNDMNDFVSGICNEKGTKNKVYPMVLILGKNGKLLHYSVGAYENVKEASEFVDLINKLE
jgi:thiol-disulfide isomerase/thioredoxin